ncbi:MAG: serine hydrolase [Chitinophagaceae bacterium]|nr:serine hydrolase [Chitinophagaceae bacterium]
MRKLYLAVALFAIMVAAIAQRKNTVTAPDRFAGLDTAFERVLKDWNAAGFAVAVVEKDKIVYAKGFGYRDFENRIPVTPATMFAIGSCTKAFTAGMIGLLAKQGKLDIDKPVRNYLPDLKFYNESMNNSIILRDMMSHRTGLPRHDFSWYSFPSHSRDSLMQRIQYMEPTYPVRERWQYNNFMFLLQGTVIEKLTGKSWEDNIRDNIFRPLNMSSSNFSIEDLERTAEPALPYGLKKDSVIKKLDYYHIDAMGPAGSINSNVLEMSNWVSVWINGGKFQGKEILPASYVTDAMSSQMVIGAGLPSKEQPDIHFANYGFGWMLASYKGHYRVEHGGNIDGFSASTCFFPTDSIGIIVLTNQNSSPVPSIVRNLIADRLLKLPYFDWSTDLKRNAEKAKAAAKDTERSKTSNRKLHTSPSHPLADYEGLYSNPGYGSIDISLINDSLFARMGRDLTWLRHYHYDIFEPFSSDPKDGIDTTDKSNLRYQFQMNTSGEIDAVMVPLEGSLAPLKFTRSPKAKELTSNELAKYIGDYEISGVTANIYTKGGKSLYLLVPGQPEYELAALGADKFSIKAASGFYLQFALNEKGEVTGLTFMQPNGNFKAKKK